MARREERRVDLLADLDRIASVDENGAAVAHEDGKAPGTGEAGEPAQPFGIGCHILSLELVLAGNDEAVEIAAFELVAQTHHALGREMAFGNVVE